MVGKNKKPQKNQWKLWLFSQKDEGGNKQQVPVRGLKKAEMKKQMKPWLTKVIMKSIKTRQVQSNNGPSLPTPEVNLPHFGHKNNFSKNSLRNASILLEYCQYQKNLMNRFQENFRSVDFGTKIASSYFTHSKDFS